MRAPRVRFTVRGLMVAVAIVAAALGTGTLAYRRAHYLGLARTSAEFEEFELWAADIEPRDRNGRYATFHRLAAEVWARRREHYERAASRPWLPPGPLPMPPPELQVLMLQAIQDDPEPPEPTGIGRQE